MDKTATEALARTCDVCDEAVAGTRACGACRHVKQDLALPCPCGRGPATHSLDAGYVQRGPAALRGHRYEVCCEVCCEGGGPDGPGG